MPPRTPVSTDQSDGDGETSPEVWQIEVVGSDETDEEDRISSALDIILAAAVHTQGREC